jgi:hypothetical protein
METKHHADGRSVIKGGRSRPVSLTIRSGSSKNQKLLSWPGRSELDGRIKTRALHQSLQPAYFFLFFFEEKLHCAVVMIDHDGHQHAH